MALYFMSYARMDHDDYVKRFFTDLQKSVGRIAPATKDRLSFIDRENIELGEQWSPALANALNTSRVLVALYSINYFSRTVCGQEWQTFELKARERAEIFGGQPPSLIVPVLFLPEGLLKASFPRVAQELNFDHAELGEDYVKLGILGLLRQGQFPRYRKVVDALAERIVSLAATNPLVPAEVNDMADVENAFEDMGPHGEPEDEQVGPGYAKFVYVVAPARDFQVASFQRQTDYYGRNRLEWRPYQPDSAEALALVAQQVTSQGKFYYEVLPLDTPDLTQQLQRAQANSNIVIMVVDAWTLRLESYYEIVQAFGSDMRLDFVVVVPWNLKDTQTKDQQKTLKSVLGKVLGERIRSGDPNLLLNPVTSADELTVRLAATLEYMRQRLVSSAPGLVVEADVKFTELPVASAVAAAPGGKGR
jgi:FxsC-like protein